MPVRSVSASPATEVPLAIPKLITDPVASFRPWPISIRIGSDTVTIPAMCAADWLDLLMQMENLWLEQIFPDLLQDHDFDIVEDALVNEKISYTEMTDLTLDIVGAAGGRPWWVVFKMVGAVKMNWDGIGGEFALQGVDPTRLSLAGWLDAAQTIILRAIDSNQKKNEFLMRLETPPPGQEALEQTVDVNTFMSMM